MQRNLNQQWNRRLSGIAAIERGRNLLSNSPDLSNVARFNAVLRLFTHYRHLHQPQSLTPGNSRTFFCNVVLSTGVLLGWRGVDDFGGAAARRKAEGLGCTLIIYLHKLRIEGEGSHFFCVPPSPIYPKINCLQNHDIFIDHSDILFSN